MFKVSHPKPKSYVSRTIKFPEELSATLKAIADREKVSFNELVRQCCQYAIEKYNNSDEIKGQKQKAESL